MAIIPTLQEYDQISEVIERYVGAARSGSGNDMAPAFDDGATVYGYMGDTLFSGSVRTLLEWTTENGPATRLRARIVSIDLCGTAATVRLELFEWTSYRFTDFLTMLKVDGRWRIINKIFYLHSTPTEPE